jgi:hypothetical protein
MQLRTALRVVLVAIALGMIATGVTVLTGPIAIPLTITLWMMAAVLVALAVLAPRASS